MLTKLGASRLLLVALCLAILAIAFTITGHGTQSVDIRSYVEMMQGILRTGLPIVENGPAARLPGMEVPWNIVVDGKLWGTYPPLYPYVAAPLLALGLHAVSIFTYALLVPLALVTQAIGRRVHDRPVHSVGAAALTIFATPIAGNAFGLASFPLAVLLVACAILAALSAAAAHGRRRLMLGALVGALGGLASSAHLLCFPMALSAIASLAIVDASTPDETRGPGILGAARSFWPRPDTLASAAAGFAGLAFAMLPVALLNHLRFGSFNPFSYGRQPWRWHEWMVDMKMGAHLRYSAVPIAVGLVAVGAWLLAGRTRLRWLLRAVVAGAVIALLAHEPELLERTRKLARVFYMYVIDTAVPDLGWPYSRANSGFANVVGDWVLKSALQSTPAFALVFVLPRMSLVRRHKLVVLLLPCVALVAALTLRANLEIGIAIGTSWVYMRYVLPAVPMLAVAAFVVVEEVRPRTWAWLLAVPVGAALCAFLLLDDNDNAAHGLLRQVLLLRVTLGVALVALVLVLLARRRPAVAQIAGAAVALVVTTSFAVSFGHDFRASLDTKHYADWRADTAAALLPTKFGLFGRAWAMDQILALKVTRDVQYADDSMTKQPADVRPVLDYWASDGRPAYYVQLFQDPAPVSPWPDLVFERIDPVQPIWKVSRRAE